MHNTKPAAFSLRDEHLSKIDLIVDEIRRAGHVSNRSDVVRIAIELLNSERAIDYIHAGVREKLGR